MYWVIIEHIKIKWLTVMSPGTAERKWEYYLVPVLHTVIYYYLKGTEII